MLIALFYFTSIKIKSLTTLTSLFYFTTTKIKFLTTLPILVYLLQLKWDIIKHLLRYVNTSNWKIIRLTLVTEIWYLWPHSLHRVRHYY